ncbi:MAG: RsmB/NOP family class I SAM-dependent RNA methyltransferase [Defluviitaleaceae bacterium]|nr:RsmB/NOP family class I SAM-dependent RNA methyltransferase [Defluviitaleaceae bacterium]
MLPIEYLQHMEELLGGEFGAYLRAMDEPSHAGIRTNRLKITPGELSRLIEKEPEGVPWCADGFYMPDGFRAGKSALYHAGLYYIQEPSAMSAAQALGVSPGERVLDLCAAPGGKSTQLAGALGGEGLLICNDVSRSRLKALVKNLELAGVRNAVVTCEEPRKLARAFPGFFDKILIDAPCSGEGMFRKDRDVLKAYSAQRIEFFARTSRDLLESAALMLSPGGRILFSTCTFNKTENEDSVDGFLASNRDFSPAEIRLKGDDGFAKGFGGNGENYRRLFPHRVHGEGHFLAVLEKRGNSSQNENNVSVSMPKSLKRAARSQQAVFRDFAAYALRDDFLIDAELYVMGDTLYTLPPGLPNLDGIRLVKTGLRLGELRQSRFEPSQALAMALTCRDVKQVADFPHTSAEVVKYLKGETLEMAPGSQDGWALVCTEGYPLGWGKVLRGILKNKYNRNWLMD